jgi:hypothetical protein
MKDLPFFIYWVKRKDFPPILKLIASMHSIINS